MRTAYGNQSGSRRLGAQNRKERGILGRASTLETGKVRWSNRFGLEKNNVSSVMFLIKIMSCS